MALERLFSRLTFRSPPPVVAVVRLSGIIGPAAPLRPGMNLAGLAETLERAFAMNGLKAVALAINSPGGSAAQSSLIMSRIRALAEERQVPVLAFIEDVGASGGYWLALAADEIWVNPNSIVGSVGVIYAGFGFNEALRKLGIERRLHTAGERKSLMDPFLPERAEDVGRLSAVQREIHDNFKEVVRARRGRRLRAGEDDLFSGEFWVGKRAVELGLADGIGDLRGIVRDRFGKRVRLRAIGRRESWLRRRLGLPPARGGEAALGHGLADGLIGALEARAWWGRYGL
ncbi:MAG: S49 family peptidase [Alphaproteobacteria bacterium]